MLVWGFDPVLQLDQDDNSLACFAQDLGNLLHDAGVWDGMMTRRGTKMPDRRSAI